MVVLTTSRGWPRVVTSNMLRPAPSSKLENLMGFFSSFLSPMGPDGVVDWTMANGFGCKRGALTKGRVCFFAKGGFEGIQTMDC